jgi:hypothetical protein
MSDEYRRIVGAPAYIGDHCRQISYSESGGVIIGVFRPLRLAVPGRPDPDLWPQQMIVPKYQLEPIIKMMAPPIGAFNTMQSLRR